MITGIPSLHASALDLSQQAQRSLHGSLGQARMLDARVSQVTAFQQAHLSDLMLQLAEERGRALLDMVA